MAKTKSILTTLAAVGTVAAAAAVIYTKREKIRELIDDAAARFAAPETEEDLEQCEADVEVDLVIEADEAQCEPQEEPEAEEA